MAALGIIVANDLHSLLECGALSAVFGKGENACNGRDHLKIVVVLCGRAVVDNDDAKAFFMELFHKMDKLFIRLVSRYKNYLFHLFTSIVFKKFQKYQKKLFIDPFVVIPVPYGCVISRKEKKFGVCS